ncbi:hypothetical protein OIO90_001209 [Microbotryomycetes sp. JL221]|nr:hypothetical protein OIO90_001209 [Microbotryomycetes sp. JL221]
MTTVKLVRYDPDNQIEVDELTRQRVLCGWNIDAIDKWKKYIQQDLKALFWVWPADTPQAEELWTRDMPDVDRCNLTPENGPPPNPEFRPLGHCSLDWYDDMGDRELACRDERPRRIQLSTFFVLTHLTGRGLGNMLLQELERIAALPPFDADIITLNTMDRSRATDPEFAKIFGWHYNPKTRVNQDWYERKGYKVFKRMVPRYQDNRLADGQIQMIEACYMLKYLKPVDETQEL